MANKIQSKGTALLMEISAVYTTVPNLKTIAISGEASMTYPSTTLDGAVHETHDLNGYVSAPTIAADVWHDPDDAVHTAAGVLLTAPLANNWKVTYVDATPTSVIYPGTGFGRDISITPTEGVSASWTIQTSGNPA